MRWRLIISYLTTLSLVLLSSCSENRGSLVNDTATLTGEPDSYTATVIRTVEEEGKLPVVFTTRITRAGDLRKEEWTEQGEAHILIWRPDLGKCFLLFPEKRLYVESLLQPLSSAKEDQTRRAPQSRTATGKADSATGDESAINDSFEAFLSSPVAVIESEVRRLPEQTLDSHRCAVEERRERFADGRSEVTKTFRAIDLSGLAIRIESLSQLANHQIKVTTERRDIQTSVPSTAFIVPADFALASTATAP